MKATRPLRRGPFDAWLPSEHQTQLLRACLTGEPSAREGFKGWKATTGGSVAALIDPGLGSRQMGPVLAAAVERYSLDTAAPLRAYLQAAALREKARWEAYRSVAVEVVSILGAVPVRTIALTGLSLSETVYPRPEQRHSHDIDLMLDIPDIPAAGEALARNGFQADPGVSDEQRRGRHWLHSSGLPVVLHRGLFQVPFYNRLTAAAWSRAVPHPTIPHVFSLSAEDQLLHICVHASTGPHRDSLLWVVDAWYLLQRPVDWVVVVTRVVELELAVPTSVALAYLRSLGAEVPEDVVGAMQRHAGGVSVMAKEVAMRGCWSGRNAGIKAIWRSALPLRSRMLVFAFKAFPSRAYVEMFDGARSGWLPWAYARRLLGAVKRRVMTRLAHRKQPRVTIGENGSVRRT